MRRHWCVVFALVSTSISMAGNGTDGFKSFHNFLFGTREERIAVKACDLSKEAKGIFPAIEKTFCIFEKGLGLTGPGERTRTFGQLVIHTLIVGEKGGAGYALAGATYDFKAEAWFCTKAADVKCDDATQFRRALQLIWTFEAGINKGHLLWDGGVISNVPGSGLSLAWDLSKDTASKFADTKVMCPICEWKFENGTATAGAKVRGRWQNDSTRADVYSIATLFVVGPSLPTTANIIRFNGSVNATDNVVTANYGIGATVPGVLPGAVSIGGVDILQNSDVPLAPAIPSNVVYAKREVDGADWKYSVVGTGPVLLVYPDRFVDVGTYTVEGILTPAGDLWNGMTVNPVSFAR